MTLNSNFVVGMLSFSLINNTMFIFIITVPAFPFLSFPFLSFPFPFPFLSILIAS